VHLLIPSNPAALLRPVTEGYLVVLIAAHAQIVWLRGYKEAKGYIFMINILWFAFYLYYKILDRIIKAIPFATMLLDPMLAGIREQ
jgi:hypothetical protein